MDQALDRDAAAQPWTVDPTSPSTSTRGCSVLEGLIGIQDSKSFWFRFSAMKNAGYLIHGSYKTQHDHSQRTLAFPRPIYNCLFELDPRRSAQHITMPVSSLYELARQRLIKNIDMLTDIGDIPFSFLEPVLRHIQNPAQLQELEENCPQIQGETGEIWKRYIRRDIPNWDKKPHTPRDPKKWSMVYRKLMRDAEKEKLEQEAQLKQHFKQLEAGREAATGQWAATENSDAAPHPQRQAKSPSTS
ncbi:hypothetical protein OPT61_g5632 [Boeremia exigua]|uniref:Uncharacterized protein n=1 Tax=Boeremia exigua TaxID=749465 RepID=A0ACC2I9L4_9PLEO|nr:hypothetical protein OPT61_g5632 [Boeremia exigua]